MKTEFDEKGKVFTDVIPKVAIPAVVQTTQHLIHGNLHVRRDERLKDELDRDTLFLAMTDAQVMGADNQVIHEARFLAVRRTQIVWVMPTRDLDEGAEL
jgi:hypothetical protein